MPKFAANISMMFNELDFLDRFAAAAAAGFEGIEFLFPYEYSSEESFENLTDDILEKYKNAPFRAPLIVILVSTKKDHPKVPRIEQIISTGTAGQNIMLALNALGYGAIWRTGRFAFNEKISEKFGLSNKKISLGEKVMS